MALRNLISVGVSALCWTIWRTRNDACFKFTYPRDPANLVFIFCYWLKYWAIMQRTEAREILELGVQMVQLVVSEILHPRHGAHGWSLFQRRIDC
ncbi:hypothetical protein BRADI_2g19836v3 [Brachypodium distachyon]|uniref:Uncharacterized protein n=1 Tax=Brachypodium distachyon TaxID=15368 RepID=A0A0Q3G200_BRADI|nr:hypothetical protein BRADI_2g19836v3 [Brachypodium distachyon]